MWKTNSDSCIALSSLAKRAIMHMGMVESRVVFERIRNRKKMRVAVEYFGGEPYEPLNLNKEQWGLVAGQIQVVSSCTRTAADRTVKQAEAQAAQEELEKVRRENEERKNVSHFKYTGVMR